MENLDKNTLRTMYREIREGIPEAQRDNYSSRISELLLSCVEFVKADAVFIYKSFGSEVSTEEIIQTSFLKGKTTCVPKTVEKEMEFLRITETTSFETNRFGIKEPVGGKLCSLTDFRCPVVIVPGLVFDLEFHRIGYGGGYYDRYLKDCNPRRVYVIAVAFECQMSENVLPYDSFDLIPDCIITQDRIRYRRKYSTKIRIGDYV